MANQSIVLARTKYGEEVYNKTLLELREEFGEEAFPAWICQMIYDAYGVKGHDHYDLSKVQLWEVTEDYCYRDQKIKAAEIAWMNASQKAYWRGFVEALRYNESLSLPFDWEGENFSEKVNFFGEAFGHLRRCVAERSIVDDGEKGSQKQNPIPDFVPFVYWGKASAEEPLPVPDVGPVGYWGKASQQKQVPDFVYKEPWTWAFQVPSKNDTFITETRSTNLPVPL
jgi:hypothetical protein